MANIKITDLTAYTNPEATDVLPIVDVGADVTKKVSVGEVVGKITGDVDVATDGASSITAGAIVNANVNAAAAIAGTKIDPDFGSQTVETTGVFSAAAGAAATPSITFTGDLNTGIYSPGADQVAVATNGTGRLFVDASGNVGIGNTTGLGGTLGVSGNISLSGSGTGTRYLGLLSETSTYAGSFLLQAGGGSSGFGGAITMYGNSHATYPGSVYIGTSTSSGGSIIFGTDNATDPSGERVRIDSSGRLLVGTSSDSGGALLQVNDNRIRIATAKTPSSAADTGTAGEICWDADYIYVCTATNTWKRTAISTW